MMSKGLPNALDVCRIDLFSPESELREKYPGMIAEKVIRLRGMYNYLLANPDLKDRQIVEETMNRFRIEKTAAYSDLAILKQIMPLINGANRNYHRWRYNEMILETYQMAKKRKDTKTMERAASSYAKYNKVDLDDEQKLPFDLIVVQPFVATSDPTPLGIKPIPNIEDKINSLIAKYRNENMDIDDVDYEDVDLEEDKLFSDGNDDDDDNGENEAERDIL